jgi:modulator of FtsH protease HflK
VRDRDVGRFALQADRVDGLVARTAESVLAEWVAGRTVDEVLLRGKIALPEQLRVQVQERLQPYELGVMVEQASVNQLLPPSEVKAAFDQLAQAQTEIRTKVNQAEQAAAVRRSEAEADAYHLQRQAAAYSQEQRLQAQAEAASFLARLAQYRKLAADNPGQLNRMWLDEMTALYARMQEEGRIEVLDHFLSREGLNITQFPLQPKKK